MFLFLCGVPTDPSTQAPLNGEYPTRIEQSSVRPGLTPPAVLRVPRPSLTSWDGGPGALWVTRTGIALRRLRTRARLQRRSVSQNHRPSRPADRPHPAAAHPSRFLAALCSSPLRRVREGSNGHAAGSQLAGAGGARQARSRGRTMAGGIRWCSHRLVSRSLSPLPQRAGSSRTPLAAPPRSSPT